MPTIHPLIQALASVLVAQWRATGKTVLNRKGEPVKEYAIAVPEGSAKSGDTVVVYKARTGELALFVLGEDKYQLRANGLTESLFVGNTALNALTGTPIADNGGGRTVTER
jgi:hypothetical protein